MSCDLEHCKVVIKKAIETIAVVGAEYNRLWTKTEGIEMEHLALKRRLQSIQKLRVEFDGRMKVFIALKNETYDACKEFEESTFDVFDTIEYLDLNAEADWKLAIAAYNEEFDAIKQKARLAEIRFQLKLGSAPKVGDKRKVNAVIDKDIESVSLLKFDLFIVLF